jgi:NAD-dependent DNA ligase
MVMPRIRLVSGPSAANDHLFQLSIMNINQNSLQMLIGICSGISADGKVNDAEIHYLQTWLTENSRLASAWPGNVLSTRIKVILSDGVITDDERSDLLKTIQSITGNYFSETGAPSPEAPAFPDVFENHEIKIAGSSFCFTGEFFFGLRRACEEAVVKRGGRCVGRVTSSLDYLVVGGRPNPDWKHGSFGLKIEHAATLQKRGALKIVREDQWTAALDSTQAE